MKNRLKYFFLLFIPLLSAGVFQACNEEELVNGGEPVIHYVRITNPNSSDSLLVAGYLGNLVAIMGDNLGDTRELWFNDREAVLNPNFVTDNSILVNIPSKAPGEVLNQMILKFGNGTQLAYDFEVAISDPALEAMKNEYAPAGNTTSISGNFFFEPLKVIFTGGSEAEIVSVTQNEITFIVPEGAEPGPVTVETNFGTTESSFHYQDQRNVFLNYDDKKPEGSWRPGLFVEDEHSIDGAYLKLKGTYSSDAPREEGPIGDNHFESQYWGQASGSTVTNLIPGDPDNYVMKFEAKVVEWYASILNICFAPYDNAGNQEVWANGFNPRAIWGPWQEQGATYSTNDGWITVTIPISDFKWEMGTNGLGNVIYTLSEKNLNLDNTGSLSFWMLGAPEADSSPFEVYIDNVRIVEK
ncbi:MAG: glycan-binding surface protein [Candidatus Cyclobacteriaceae bacterium M2_1C_046]